MQKLSSAYGEALETATVAPDKKHPLVHLKEKRKNTNYMPVRVLCEEGETSADYHAMSSEAEDSQDDYGDDVPENSTEKVPDKIAVHPVLVKFSEWLASPDGGKRDDKTVNQHACQLYKILQAIDDTEDTASLLDLRLIRTVFLKTKYEAGTIKSYLMSLRHYLSFLLSERPVEVPFNVDDIHAAREKVALWSTSYKRQSCTRKWQKLEEDLQTLRHSRSSAGDSSRRHCLRKSTEWPLRR